MDIRRSAVPTQDGNWLVTVEPPVWSGFGASSISLTDGQYRRYRQWLQKRMPIQEVLPDLSDGAREILMSGIGPREWEKSFKEDAE